MTAAPIVTCGYSTPQAVLARSSFTLPGAVTWAAGQTGTVLWTGGSTPITNATSNTATVADIGWPTLLEGTPLQDDTVTWTFTATQSDDQVVSATMTITRVCGNRWSLKGTTYVCMPPAIHI